MFSHLQFNAKAKEERGRGIGYVCMFTLNIVYDVKEDGLWLAWSYHENSWMLSADRPKGVLFFYTY
jgi:hypothetical protein